MSHSLTLYNKLHLHLFEGKSIAESYLDEKELEVKKRIEAAFAIVLDNPLKSEKAIRQFLVNQFDVNERTAFRDVALMKQLFGDFRKTSKEYYRHRALAVLDEAIELAKGKNDYYGIIAAVKEIIRATRLDQHDPEEIPWSDVSTPNFEPTGDIEALGYKRNPNIDKIRKRLEKKYFGVQDAEIVE